jgi:LTXXQ motif family protein
MPTISAAENSQILDKSLMLAQAHERDKGDKSKEKKGKSDKDSHGGGKHGKKDHNYAHMIASHADALELTDEQLGKITRLEMHDAEAHKKTKQEVQKSMKEFHKASMKLGTNDAMLRKLGTEHVDEFNAMVDQHIREREAVHDVLTADQDGEHDHH